MLVKRTDRSDYLRAATDAIDHTNFKARADERLGARRHSALTSVWAALRRLEGEIA